VSGDGRIDWGRVSALFGIVASLGGVVGFFFSQDSQRCLGLRGIYRGHPFQALKHCADDARTPANHLALAGPPAMSAPSRAAVAAAPPTPAATSSAAAVMPSPTLSAPAPRATGEPAVVSAVSAAPAASSTAEPPGAPVGRLAGTRWVFYDGDRKTFADFAADGSLTFSDPFYGADGSWKLAGKRDVAFHTDAFEFSARIGRDVPDNFVATYRHLPRGDASPEPAHEVTFVRVP